MKNEVRSVYKEGTKDEKKSKGVIPDASQKYAGEKIYETRLYQTQHLVGRNQQF